MNFHFLKNPTRIYFKLARKPTPILTNTLFESNLNFFNSLNFSFIHKRCFNEIAFGALKKRPIPPDMSIYPLRPPIVTIMGHVDHGKTTLLDALRKSSVAAGEAGGITQHIGAFSVTLPSKQTITFLDTPGHAAFSAMRARGAHVTDIVVLVVAADDGVMPQTIEAINHAKNAGVPIVVAINKIDKHNANTAKVRESLLAHGIDLEEFGGETQAVEVSGLTGYGLDSLEESIIVLAEIMDLRAEIDIPSEGVVIESQIERGRGDVATILIKRGTLKLGSVVVGGTAWCRVRSMIDDKGRTLQKASPGTPVRVIGWKDLPQAGDEVIEAPDEDSAKSEVEYRLLLKEQQKLAIDSDVINQKRKIRQTEVEQEKSKIKDFRREVWLFHQGMRAEYPVRESIRKPESFIENHEKELRAVVKGSHIKPSTDVSGTIEAVVDALNSIGNSEVHFNVVQHGVGNITESDVQMASTSKGIVLGFNVKADRKVQNVAKQEKVEIVIHNVIYKLLDEVKIRMSELLPPILQTHVTGEATILQIFQLNVKGRETKPVAGCRVINGKVLKNQKVKIFRKDQEIWEGMSLKLFEYLRSIDSFKQVKKDITEATKGVECGISFDGFIEFKEGINEMDSWINFGLILLEDLKRNNTVSLFMTINRKFCSKVRYLFQSENDSLAIFVINVHLRKLLLYGVAPKIEGDDS
ncbi:hypothetical protein G9A89_007605 [Geosiphon pyriformis]|nr:hypothetical protein G9A89_007605 [Geosiphon pyriformis]